ncbi:MAG TPA: zinc ribbon domain-containing protein [Blastocatellia bacterium]|nr:zinc ribbon domain-containing protein [Blastocatellia bacterium]
MQLKAVIMSSRFGLDTVECDLKLVLPGTVESLRPRLATALEQMGYHVVSDEPLQARRGGTSFSLEVLKYPISLFLGFKPVGERATQVTFSYSLKHSGVGLITKGDLPVLAREAEAVAAIALRELQGFTCDACGSDNPRGARFCRRCGAPLVISTPAEVELLHLVAQGRVAFQAITSSAVVLMVAMMLFALLPGKPERVATLLGVASAIMGFIPLWWGIYKLRRSLRPKEAAESIPFERRLEEVPPIASFPSSGVPMSVTERTTQLLDEPARPPVVTEDRRGEESV